jgi:hypothetical protein
MHTLIGELAQAARDYEYMTTGLAADDYFIVSSKRYYDGQVLQSAMLDYHDAKKDLYERKFVLNSGPWERPDRNNRAEPIGFGIRKFSRKMFWRKVSAAFIGAGFLVGPMWLLALEQQLYLQLEVTKGFVLSFGITLAYFMDKFDQVFAGTLAYAAVLVVFVGLSVQGVEGKQEAPGAKIEISFEYYSLAVAPGQYIYICLPRSRKLGLYGLKSHLSVIG